MGRSHGTAFPVRSRHLALLVLLVAALCAAALAPRAAADSTVTVNTTNAASPMGDGLCSLVEAINYANGSAEPDCARGTASGTTTINIQASATKYSIPSVLAITRNTIINGAGAASTIIDGGGATQLFSIAAGAHATISGVTISGGNPGDSQAGCTGSGSTRSCPAENGLDGGGIANAGTLTLTSSVVTGNATAAGALPLSPAIPCQPDCPRTPGSTAGSGGNGGGIYNAPDATLTIANSSISANATGAGGSGTDGFSGSGTLAGTGEDGGSGGFGGSGGGIFNDSGATLTIANTVLAGNATGAGGNAGSGSGPVIIPSDGGNAGSPSAGGYGGAIFNLGTLTVTGSTLSGNATGVGGNGATGGETFDPPDANGAYSASAGGGFGGALFNDSSPATTTTLTDDTFVANKTGAGGTGGASNGPGGDGGAVEQYLGGPVLVTFDTIADNTAAGSGGGLFAGSGAIVEANSIVTSNIGTPGANCNAGVADHGGDVVFGQTSCPGTVGDPKLGLLAANGGPTATMALESGSAAVDVVPINACAPAVDQRGVARPQGSACDAGAYELAPPAIASAIARGASTSTGAVIASITPNLKDTSVTVRYGTTTAYGSTTTAQDIGTGPAAFATVLRGLHPRTTYHVQVIASNGDGTVASADIAFRTMAPLAAALSSTQASGDQLKLTIACGGGNPGQVCAGRAKLASHVTMRGGSAVAVAAASGKKTRPELNRTTKVETIGSASYAAARGRSTTVRIRLNSTGRKLLEQFSTLPATLTVTGTTRLSKTVTLTGTGVR